jgi:ATP-dependent DNA helicase RecG
LLEALGVTTIGDLLYHLPVRYEDRRHYAWIASLEPGVPVVIKGDICKFTTRVTKKRGVTLATFELFDGFSSVKVVLFGGTRSFWPLDDGKTLFLYGTPSISEKNFLEMISPEYFVSALGAVPPWLRLWPIYPTAGGLSRSWLANLIHSCASSSELAADDPLPSDILGKYSFPSLTEAFKGIHAPDSFEEAERSRDRFAYQDFYENELMIAEREHKRGLSRAPSLASGADMRDRYISGLPFELCESQRIAVSEIERDLDAEVPMSRILIGDVGSGKTAVAASAAARCVGAGYQAAILVPTTILADQFFAFCDTYFSPLGVKVEKLSGGMSRGAKDDLLWRLRDGEIDVIVGTHAMLGEGVVFKSLGLLVIDEQQRFGVFQREKILSENRGAHLLMTTATPIPRTMRMAIYGDVACTEMASRPDKGRIITRVMSDNHTDELYKFLAGKIHREGERCYWVCPLIGDEDGVADDSSVANRSRDIKRAMRGVAVEVMTGAMSSAEKSAVMERFSASPGILVSTTVIEVGIDVRGANIMIIEAASSYGLSQLHQMRGRVGRGTKQGVCILLDSARNIGGNRRLTVLMECDDGFKIAEEDLMLRGAGEYLGTRQHGDENFRVAELPRDERWFLSARNDVKSA